MQVVRAVRQPAHRSDGSQFGRDLVCWSKLPPVLRSNSSPYLLKTSMLRILDARLPGSVGDRPLAKGWEDFSAARKAATAYDQLHSNLRESAAGKCRFAFPQSQPTRQGFLFAA